MINLEEAVIRKLKTAQYILCTVESCTGGQIAYLLTNVSGASEVYWGSFVTYDNSAKEELGVSRSLIETHGVVSPEVAAELAEQGLAKMQDTLRRSAPSFSLIKPRGFICLSTTGIAGPTGGTSSKPIGLCYIALALSGKGTLTEEFHASRGSNRVQTKMQFTQKALELIRENI